MKKELNVCGLIAMILALVGLFIFGLPCGIASIVLGIIGLMVASENKGIGMAVTGLVIGIVDVVAVLWLQSILMAV